jgi:hypothetical protein
MRWRLARGEPMAHLPLRVLSRTCWTCLAGDSDGMTLAIKGRWDPVSS